MNVSVLIVNFNGGDVLPGCLASIPKGWQGGRLRAEVPFARPAPA